MIDHENREDELYLTKAQLIEAQIECWTLMREERVTNCNRLECQHESDGQMRLSYPGKWKCLKCGEFYR